MKDPNSITASLANRIASSIQERAQSLRLFLLSMRPGACLRGTVRNQPYNPPVLRPTKDERRASAGPPHDAARRKVEISTRPRGKTQGPGNIIAANVRTRKCLPAISLSDFGEGDAVRQRVRFLA
jgi:hypothetical protein